MGGLGVNALHVPGGRLHLGCPERRRRSGPPPDPAHDGRHPGFGRDRPRLRRLPVGEPASATPGPTRLERAGGPPSTAAYLIPATGATEYVAEATTAIDATAASLDYSSFFVRAWTGPYTYYDSGLEHGISVDNLAPPAPSPFTAHYEAGATHLRWAPSPAADFETFRLHRGASPDFSPGPATLVATSSDTGHVDVGPPGSHYKLSAVDEHGNESPFATLGPDQTVDVPQPSTILTFGIDPIRPNPAARNGLRVRFTLPAASAARLELVNVAGRRVAVREVGALGIGTHLVDFSAEARALPSGVYLARLVQGERTSMQRVVLIARD